MSPQKVKKWSNDKTTKFLELYEQYPCLWDHSCKMYKDREKRDCALKNIVKAMKNIMPDFDVQSVKSKIRSIRNAYTLEVHKVNKSRKSGASADKIYKPTVPWFSTADRFLRHVVEIRDTKDKWVSKNNVFYYIVWEKFNGLCKDKIN